ncbi:uncharacterized protein LOC114540654 [Dendronephthya gigantea]|uniref:uncharacterized protein LOC114540654 n=1 Tax=Dendronephthya gigantea TaxID=151771 RepID=UPI00106A7536|nr:uncharacterized protein LOC114540654 [Dendronephthya gigantea]
MEGSRISKFCHSCGSTIEPNFKFCSQCGQPVVISTDNQGRGVSADASRPTGSETTSTNASRTSKNQTTRVAKSKLSLSSFSAFKTAKEKERSSFFVRKKGSKRAKPNDNDVKITIAVMEDSTKIKRGDALPLKVPTLSSAKDILDASVKKHATFNKRFNSKLKYALVFKDGTEVTTVPGTSPPEPFTLRRYKEVSGFGYSQIRLYLVPLMNKKISDLKAVLEDSDSESLSVSDDDNSEPPDVLGWDDKSVSVLNLPVTAPGPFSSFPSSSSDANPSTASTSSRSFDMLPSTSTSTIMKVDCPLCFKSFPIDEVEQHADGCSASFALVTESDREVRVISGKENSAVELVNIEETSNGCTLVECITNLQNTGLKPEMESVRITVRRKMVWEDFKRSRYRYYEPDRNERHLL